MQVLSQVFTAKCSELQAGVSNNNGGGESGVAKSMSHELKPDIRLNGGKGFITNQSRKGKCKLETVNSEVV